MARIEWKPVNVSICCVIFVIILVALSVFLLYQQSACSDDTSMKEIEVLCGYFDKRFVDGTLCSALCNGMTLVYSKCLHFGYGKVVYLMDLNGHPVIMKSKYAQLNRYFSFEFGVMEPLETLFIPSTTDFLSMIESLAHFRLGWNNNLTGLEVIQRLWNPDFDFNAGDDIKQNRPAKISIWLLMQQSEFVLSSYLQTNQHVPKIHGTCGHYYITEYLPSGRHLSASFPTIIRGVLFDDYKSWKHRAVVSLRLLELVHSFDNDLVETLHVCDMKGTNFGSNEQGKIKATDLDMVFFQKELEFQFIHTNCTKHSDCDFADCMGWCELRTGKCSSFRINNNLQALCAKVFLSHLDNGYGGLLDHPPLLLKSQLLKLLNLCSNPPVSKEQLLVLPGCSDTISQISSNITEMEVARECLHTADDSNLLRFKASDLIWQQLHEFLSKV